MTGSGTFSISGAVTSLLTGSKAIGPLVITSADAVAETRTFPCDTGNTTIEVPDGAVAAIVVPDPTNTASLHLKGVTGDTGIAISAVNAFLLSFDTAVSEFVIESDDDDQSVQVVFL